jgi:hypothetical protein
MDHARRDFGLLQAKSDCTETIIALIKILKSEGKGATTQAKIFCSRKSARNKGSGSS